MFSEICCHNNHSFSGAQIIVNEEKWKFHLINKAQIWVKYFYIKRIVIFLKGREICKDNFWGLQPKDFEDPCLCMPFNIKILNLKPSSYTTKISLYRLQYYNNFWLKILMLKILMTVMFWARGIMSKLKIFSVSSLKFSILIAVQYIPI